MLRVDDLHTYYGDSYVLQGVSLEVRPGATAVLMGRNGVGKSTTVKSVCGLMRPRRGTIHLDDEDLTGVPAHRVSRAGVALVPQGRRVFPSLTVREHLEVAGGRRDREERWTVERLFELFPNLANREHLRAGSLSGGEQSMLAIARALRTEPRYLLMDEPTEGLAPVFVEKVMGVIRQLRDEGEIGLLVVLPELPLARSVADEVFVMAKGTVAYRGPIAEFLTRTDVQEQHIGIG